VHGLIVGSAEAYAGPGGIALSAGLHAVRTTDYKSICGDPVVFMFLDTAFTGTEQGAVCPSCRALVSPFGAA
jgi:hypothetical protein